MMKLLSFKRHRFPPDTIRLYFRFTTSLRNVEEMLAERGFDTTYETVRCRANKFGPAIAAIRKRRSRSDSVWHLDEMIVRINGKTFMWRAVDSEGEVLDVLVQKRQNKEAALKLLRKLLKNQGFIPNAIVTDGLASYKMGIRELGCKSRHRPGRLRDNNRVENSHLLVLRRRLRKYLACFDLAWSDVG
jgi:transposase-like protein